MVGVPGRSRGCLTCRRRKKGCDQQKPVCGQCRRSNLVCQGYQNALTFVRYHPERVGLSHFSTARDDTLSGQVPVTVAHRSLINTAIDVFLFDKYWETFFPKAKEDGSKWIPPGGIVSTWLPAGWALEIRDRSADSILIRTGLQAIAYSTVGQRDTESRLSVAGMQAYSLALQEVHRSLQHSERRKSDDVLAACKLLALYEAQQGSGFNWEKHTLGVLRLLLIRGPSAHATGLSHALFLDARYQGIVASIRRRERLFLDEPEWCSVPWVVNAKDLRHEFLDIMIRVPLLLVNLDRMEAGKSTNTDTPERRRSFLEACKALTDDLRSWLVVTRSRFDADRIGLIENGIPDDFPLSNIMLAHVMILYWACSLLVNTTILKALREFPVDDNPFGKEDTANFDIQPFIMNIAKSIPYFFQPEAGSITAQTFSFPLGVALMTAQYTNVDQTPEYRRLLRAFSKGRTGDMIRHFLTSLLLLGDADDSRAHELEQPALHYSEARKKAEKWHEEGSSAQKLPLH